MEDEDYYYGGILLEPDLDKVRLMLDDVLFWQFNLFPCDALTLTCFNENVRMLFFYNSERSVKHKTISLFRDGDKIILVFEKYANGKLIQEIKYYFHSDNKTMFNKYFNLLLNFIQYYYEEVKTGKYEFAV